MLHVIALDGASVTVIGPAGRASSVAMDVRVLPVEPGLVRHLAVVVSHRQQVSSSVRTWTLQHKDGIPLKVETVEYLRTQFTSDQGPDRAEVTMRAIANGCGWPIPRADAAPVERY